MRSLVVAALLVLIAIAFPPHRARGQQDGKSRGSGEEQLSENLQIIHALDAEHVVDSTLVAIRKNRADSLRGVIDSINKQL